MAMLEDYSYLFWRKAEEYYKESKTQGFDLMVVYSSSTEDVWNIENSTYYIRIKKGQERHALTELVEASSASESLCLDCVYDLSLPFEQAKKDITILPPEVIIAFNSIMREKKLAHEEGKTSKLARGLKKLKASVFGY